MVHFQIQNILRKTGVEIILDNRIEKDLELSLQPLNFLTSLYFQRKFQILQGFVTPNSYTSIVSSFLCFCSILTIEIVFTINNYIPTLSQDFPTILRILPLFDISFYISGFIINFICSYIQSGNLVKLITSIQRSHKVLRYVESKSYHTFKVNNWIFMSLFIAVHSFLFTLQYTFLHIGSYLTSIQLLLVGYFDMNMVFCLRTMGLLQFELNLWIEELSAFSEAQVSLNEGQENEVHCKEMMVAYTEVMSAYKSFTKVFQIPIFFHALETFIHTMCYVELVIAFAKMSTEGNGGLTPGVMETVAFIVLWVIKNLALLYVTGIEFDRFYATVDIAELTCTRVLKMNHIHDSLKVVCKNVIRVRVACFSRMSACGVFSVDAGLVLRLLQLVATYTVVLLQFAFL